MAKNTTIKHIKSSVSGSVPAYTSLEYGELAINYADGALFYRNSSDEVIPVASVNNNLVTGEYLFDAGTASSDPGSGLVRLNSTTRSSVTAIYIDQLSNLKTDVNTILKSVLVGDVIVWQDKATAANTVRYRVTAAPTNNTGWWSIPVEWMSETGSLWTASTLLSFTLHRIGTIGTNGLVNGAVTLAKMADMATSSLIYRKTAGSGAPEVNTLATLKTDLGLTGTNSGDQTISLTGDVTGSGTGSFAATIANDVVTYAKIQNVAAQKVLGRVTNSSGDAEEISTTGWSATAKVVMDQSPTLVTPAFTGLPTGTGVASAATASTLAARDSNANLSADSFVSGYTTTATAAGTTVLTVDSTQYQFFTGTTTQTITLPVTSTLVLGQTFYIHNNSTGALTVNSSGGNLVATVPAGVECKCTVILTSGTTAASWDKAFENFQTITGTGDNVLATSPTLVTPNIGTPSAGTLTNCTGLPTAGLVNGAVTLAKMDNMATSSLIYRKSAGSGAPEVNTLATLKTDLGLTGTNSGDQTITLTGDVTGSGTGSFAATIANSVVTAAKQPHGLVTVAAIGETLIDIGNSTSLVACLPSGKNTFAVVSGRSYIFDGFFTIQKSATTSGTHNLRFGFIDGSSAIGSFVTGYEFNTWIGTSGVTTPWFSRGSGATATDCSASTSTTGAETYNMKISGYFTNCAASGNIQPAFCWAPSAPTGTYTLKVQWPSWFRITEIGTSQSVNMS